MSIVSKYGKPSLFITMTCSPAWKEITDCLLDGQKPHDRPDIVARVFRLKLAALLHDIKVKHVLGVVVASVHVIEFQKRGLPHAHMLFMLRDEDKLRDDNDVDSVVCAELPDEELHPELFKTVKASMIHGPCGAMNPNSVCMENGQCKKGYPKDFANNTRINVNGYPLYKRSSNGTTATVGRHDVDNRWVVPYNPWLSKKYDCHINVEVCSSIKSIKYLFKYVYKVSLGFRSALT